MWGSCNNLLTINQNQLNASRKKSTTHLKKRYTILLCSAFSIPFHRHKQCLFWKENTGKTQSHKMGERSFIKKKAYVNFFAPSFSLMQTFFVLRSFSRQYFPLAFPNVLIHSRSQSILDMACSPMNFMTNMVALWKLSKSKYSWPLSGNFFWILYLFIVISGYRHSSGIWEFYMRCISCFVGLAVCKLIIFWPLFWFAAHSSTVVRFYVISCGKFGFSAFWWKF